MTDDATAAARQNWDAASAGWERNADLVFSDERERERLVDRRHRPPAR